MSPNFEAWYRDQIIQQSEAIGILRGVLMSYQDDDEDIQIPLKEVRRTLLAVGNALTPDSGRFAEWSEKTIWNENPHAKS